MKHTLIILGLFLFLHTGQIALGQTNKEKALEKGQDAIRLMDKGEIEESIKLLEEAQKLDPDRFDYPYEIAYAYYLSKDYKQAIKVLEKNANHKDVSDRLFQLLGNSYDNFRQSEKAIETYQKGLKKFPNSGSLYLELGVMEMGRKEYNKALGYWEQGIKVAPKFPSNYYWAAKIFCNSDEEVWGMIYGEIFINLERNSKRTTEISKLLFDTYRKSIEIKSLTSMSVSFSKAVINIDGTKDPKDFKLPFGIGVYEPLILLSTVTEKAIDLNSLDRIRTNFVKLYYEKGHDKSYPNILFDYHKQMADAGQLEAYNHYALMMGDEQAFQDWKSSNSDKWSSFTKWYSANYLKVDEEHKFFREQY